MWGELMQRLRYQDYLARGGDRGSVTTHRLLTKPYTECMAGHANLPLVIPDDFALQSHEAKEVDCVPATLAYQKRESGYPKQQSCKSQTLAYGLADSLVGQLARIAEK